MPRSIVQGDVHVQGALSCGSLSPPAASVGNQSISGAASLGGPLDYDKLEHLHPLRLVLVGTVASSAQPLHIALGAAGAVVALEALVLTPPTGDYTVEVDLQKGSQAAAYATVLSAPLEIDSAVAARQVVEGALVADPSYDDGDSLQLVVTAAGATGTQAAHLLIVVWVREDPQP